MLYVINLVVIILILIIIFSKNREGFQYILDKETGEFEAKRYFRVKPNNIMFTIPTEHDCDCAELCKLTPRCQGINHFLNECTLYKNLYK